MRSCYDVICLVWQAPNPFPTKTHLSRTRTHFPWGPAMSCQRTLAPDLMAALAGLKPLFLPQECKGGACVCKEAFSALRDQGRPLPGCCVLPCRPRRWQLRCRHQHPGRRRHSWHTGLIHPLPHTARECQKGRRRSLHIEMRNQCLGEDQESRAVPVPSASAASAPSFASVQSSHSRARWHGH